MKAIDKAKHVKKPTTAYNAHLPNEFHRLEKWSGSQVVRNRKKYSRKSKNSLPLDTREEAMYQTPSSSFISGVK